MSLNGRVILITGASNGIGKACAQAVAAAGANVIINYHRDAISAEYLAQSIGLDRTLVIQADASRVEGTTAIVKAAVAKFGRIDTVLANAGVTIEHTSQDVTEDDFDKNFALNVKGPLFLVKEAVPYMSTGSQIVFVSSGLTRFSSIPPNLMLFAATKGAVDQMTRAMAKELGPKGISGHAIAPGPVATDVFLRDNSNDFVEGLKAASPFNRLGKPEDIANLFRFLCGNEGAWATGQILLATGGVAV